MNNNGITKHCNTSNLTLISKQEQLGISEQKPNANWKVQSQKTRVRKKG